MGLVVDSTLKKKKKYGFFFWFLVFLGNVAITLRFGCSMLFVSDSSLIGITNSKTGIKYVFFSNQQNLIRADKKRSVQNFRSGGCFVFTLLVYRAVLYLKFGLLVLK